MWQRSRRTGGEAAVPKGRRRRRRVAEGSGGRRGSWAWDLGGTSGFRVSWSFTFTKSLTSACVPLEPCYSEIDKRAERRNNRSAVTQAVTEPPHRHPTWLAHSRHTASRLDGEARRVTKSHHAPIGPRGAAHVPTALRSPLRATRPPCAIAACLSTHSRLRCATHAGRQLLRYLGGRVT